MIPIRYLFAILGAFGMGLIYGYRVNISVALLRMVNHTVMSNTSTNSEVAMEGTCAAHEDKDEQELTDGDFNWSTSVEGAIKSSYYWGYLLGAIPGSQAAELISAKWVMFFSVIINVACTSLSPIAAKLHYRALMAMRAIQGLAGGVVFPSMHVMLSRWAPSAERAFLNTIVLGGSALGTVIFTLMTGMIIFYYGWEAVFYIQAAIGLIWMPLWVWLVTDTPAQHKFISEDEKTLIISSIGDASSSAKKRPPIPWRYIIRSTPYWAVLIAQIFCAWGWYLSLIELPNYMQMILKLKIKENAVLSSLPYFTMWVFSLILSRVLDKLRQKKKLSTTAARKIATFIASFIPMVCFAVVSFIGCLHTHAIVIMTIAITANGAVFSGHLVNHIDLAPNFAGTLMAIAITLATIPPIIIPLFVGVLTEKRPDITSWRIVFGVTDVLYLITIVVYLTFASAEEQHWNRLE